MIPYFTGDALIGSFQLATSSAGLVMGAGTGGATGERSCSDANIEPNVEKGVQNARPFREGTPWCRLKP